MAISKGHDDKDFLALLHHVEEFCEQNFADKMFVYALFETVRQAECEKDPTAKSLQQLIAYFLITDQIGLLRDTNAELKDRVRMLELEVKRLSWMAESGL
jgi:predicted NUDIX family phosphoesterase